MIANLRPYLTLLRPEQWVKNLIIFTVLLFSVEITFQTISKLLYPLICFILASSTVYIFNDIADKKRDSLHKYKNQRPLASGLISCKSAYILCSLMLILCLLVSYITLNKASFYIIIAYLFIQFFYSTFLKFIFITDVITISLGFVLRVLIGYMNFDINNKLLIVLLIIFIAYIISFIVFGKRYHELSGESNNNLTVAKYTINNLSILMLCCGIGAIILYSAMLFYTQKDINFLSIVPLIFGMWRYFYDVKLYKGKGQFLFQKIFLQDKLFVINLLLWMFIIVI